MNSAPEKFRKHRLRRSVLQAFTYIPVLMIPALEWVPGISKELRTWLILPALLIAAAAFLLSNREERKIDEVLRQNLVYKKGVEKAEPDYLLRLIALSLFREGAWRLTVYRKEHSAGDGIGDQLVRLASVASDGDQQSLGPHTIRIVPATMFEHYFRSNLADERFRSPQESGHGPENVHSSAWSAWRTDLFGVDAVVGDTSTFRARKFAWYAAQEPADQVVFSVVAESAEPEGIAVEHLDHTFTAAWLFFVSRLAELRASAAHAREQDRLAEDD